MLEDTSVMMKKVVGQIITQFFSHFPRVSEAIVEESHRVIDSQVEMTTREIEKMLVVEQSLTFAKNGFYEAILSSIETEQAKLIEEQKASLMPTVVNPR